MSITMSSLSDLIIKAFGIFLIKTEKEYEIVFCFISPISNGVKCYY